MTVGTSKDRVIIDIGETVKQHAAIWDTVLAAHALSGCDTTAKMNGIGKGKVKRVLLKGVKLSKMGDPNAVWDDVLHEATNFVTMCYGCHKNDISECRFDIWSSKMSKKCATSAPKLKDLPPTRGSFEQNVRRAHLQTCIWKSASLTNPQIWILLTMDGVVMNWWKDSGP